jgi:hypothetical protein
MTVAVRGICTTLPSKAILDCAPSKQVSRSRQRRRRANQLVRCEERRTSAKKGLGARLLRFSEATSNRADLATCDAENGAVALDGAALALLRPSNALRCAACSAVSRHTGRDRHTDERPRPTRKAWRSALACDFVPDGFSCHGTKCHSQGATSRYSHASSLRGAPCPSSVGTRNSRTATLVKGPPCSVREDSCLMLHRGHVSRDTGSMQRFSRRRRQSLFRRQMEVCACGVVVIFWHLCRLD